MRDIISRELRQKGVAVGVKHSEVISSSEEELLWEKGILGIDSPAALLNAVFYGKGKVLCLRGGREHWGLKLSQFEFGDEKDANGEVTSYVVYSENGSKNRSGSTKIKHQIK